ncbi:hypothetical protein [Chitinophaga qingshengii]|uniref:Beta-carotene 15,15'-monooxygenase n=1 Tax=Chitinophaga qingshengii TaxID=1569794 RepID=A0ABR7TLS7_9BACT|nr:hypothetical protein [Chitinophaga qingshengii]MBC9930374.1 hypothetical protein [Chitinophaga qingshengii]
MRSVTAILQKIFTAQFYIQNTGFFLVLFYLLFGVVDSGSLLNYHRSLMMGFLEGSSFLLLVLALWALYGLKCVGFMMKVLQSQGYEFLYPTMGSLDKKTRFRQWFLLHNAIYLPVWIYAGIAVLIGLKHHYYVSAGIILVFNIAMSVWPLALYDRKLFQPDIFFFTGYLQRWINRRFTKPPVLYFLYELFTQFPRRILTAKLVSAMVLWLTFFLMHEGNYFDLRGLQLGVMLSVLLHLQLLSHHRVFDDTWLNFMENLPVSTLRHYGRMAAIYLIIWIPEIVMITVNAYTKTSWLSLLTVFCMALSLLMFFRSLLYFPKMNNELHVRYVLITCFVVLFMILGHYEWLAILLLQALSAIVFFRQYRRYEPYIEP